jgi:hypothetical protein
VRGTGPSLAETLTNPACRGFRDGLQVIVTTDSARPGGGRASTPDDQQRWIVLRTAAFSGLPGQPSSPPVGLAKRPWLCGDSAERIPALLRGGWKEARHGT